jgi:hypothetical protein
MPEFVRVILNRSLRSSARDRNSMKVEEVHRKSNNVNNIV